MDQKIMRVVVAEDNDNVRRAIRRLLNRADDIEVVGEAHNGIEALRLVEEMEPDVLLLDVEMPLLTGIEVARRLKRDDRKTKILVLSVYDDNEYIHEMISNGASGYLIKDSETPKRIIEALYGVARGESGWVSPQVEAKLRKK